MDLVESSKLVRSTTAVDVARILRNRILAGHYAEDQFIRQELIASELGVSRIPVREALAQLEAEGLVVRQKYRGALVPKLSLGEIQEIYEMRGMLEPYLLEAAIPNITREVIDRLRSVVERSRTVRDITEWAGLNMEFHRTLYAQANKPLSVQVLENLLTRADRYLKVQRFLSTGTQEESDAEHQRILDLIEEGNGAGAVDALRQHISWNAEDIRRTIGLDD
ncbi:GntR family transcriptional regulator [Novosphingobium aquimarinum]|uniref:GntR family transcriptional regulator n=1 Tax=Novosphingobium aquimarinum TaxID=2682494 RepID=UPI0012EB6078|nr:GntR family transcriptional regulator [Novosphingobium aquimarinum]